MRAVLHTQQAMSLARAGDHQRAVAEVGDLAQAPDLSGENLYELACVASVASAAAKERRELAERCAAEAVNLLRRAQRAGLFSDAATIARVRQDADLDALRQRDDFRELIEGLDRVVPTSGDK